ncbi:hypothetical protein BD779DRAFT_1675424 [Infundibulicybe gibba]|nr:hypothetical protein BD779DRAFT_1675424 [Infundibulicybe gibba]
MFYYILPIPGPDAAFGQDETSNDPIAISNSTGHTGRCVPVPSIGWDFAYHFAKPPEAPAPCPLIAQPAQTRRQYGDFRDYNLALRVFKGDITTSAPDLQVIQIALEGLSHYAEGARVELKIRIADEELLARMFEMSLSVPEALRTQHLPTLEMTRRLRRQVDARIGALVSASGPVYGGLSRPSLTNWRMSSTILPC